MVSYGLGEALHRVRPPIARLSHSGANGTVAMQGVPFIRTHGCGHTESIRLRPHARWSLHTRSAD